jgi:hypothetical protein
MKTLIAAVLISVLCELSSTPLAAVAQVEVTFTWNLKGASPNGDSYAFDVRMSAKDRWDSASQDAPPLPAGKAIRLAKGFIAKVPLGEHFSLWRMGNVRLLRSEDTEGHEIWLYAVEFWAANPNLGRNGMPDMSVPVRMDGTIPEPVITKSKEVAH